MERVKTVYLAGKITGDPEYKSKFAYAQAMLERAGFVVLNPAILPGDAFSYEAYIRMSRAMMMECDAVCLLGDWQSSKGARAERMEAGMHDIPVFAFEEWLEAQRWGGEDGREVDAHG